MDILFQIILENGNNIINHRVNNKMLFTDFIKFIYKLTFSCFLAGGAVVSDGFLLAYTMWYRNSCWVGSSLFFPVCFSSNSKKEAPIGVPGTSIRSVPTLMDERISTHTLCQKAHFSHFYCQT